MAHEGRRRGFTVEREGYLFYRPFWGLYGYSARTTADPADHDPMTRVWFDASNGHLFYFQGPVGENATDATMRWFYMLHMAQVFGLPYRIFVSLLGVAVVALSVTGIAIWMKKRSARLLGNRRTPRAAKVDQMVPAAAELKA
nr:PepSY-associated TM helix domain-containing protein [Sphingobium fuliginis]